MQSKKPQPGFRLGHRLCLGICFTLLWGCTAPNPTYLPGKTIGKGRIQGGFASVGSVPTATIKAVGEGALAALSYVDGDTLIFDENLKQLQKGLLAFALQPFAMGYEFYARYGLLENLDAGYKFASGKHAFEIQHQLVGREGGPYLNHHEHLDVSIGVQFSRYTLELPEVFQLAELQDVLDFYFRRTDVFVPLTLSRDFGGKQDLGFIGMGLLAGYSKIHYRFASSVLDESNMEVYSDVDFQKGYLSYGGFLNGRLGYRYAFVTASLALLFENVGEVENLKGDIVELGGAVIQPTLGLTFLF